MQENYCGPTVYEMCRIKIKEIRDEQARLSNEMRLALNRLFNPKYAHMDEAERLANESECYQNSQLPQRDDVEDSLRYGT